VGTLDASRDRETWRKNFSEMGKIIEDYQTGKRKTCKLFATTSSSGRGKQVGARGACRLYSKRRSTGENGSEPFFNQRRRK